jgi:hypothetical protein
VFAVGEEQNGPLLLFEMRQGALEVEDANQTRVVRRVVRSVRPVVLVGLTAW